MALVSSPAPKAGSWQAQLHDVIAVRVLAIFRQAGTAAAQAPSFSTSSSSSSSRSRAWVSGAASDWTSPFCHVSR
ncbi:hypothetical protein JCM24511_02991 [Saitozyma sp. JCM 24511]|nr:hypothetical protein JCM24511_02991 [Saitozyma sp. JCM 24511]